MTDLTNNQSPFEGIKKIHESGLEYWHSRELASLLGYADYDKFLRVIEKAEISCEGSGYERPRHFRHVAEMIRIGKGGLREVESVLLTRYACYLLVQNADSRKKMVALGQTYFAVQTRRQEVADQAQLEEDRKRLTLRDDMRTHNASLADAAYQAGVGEGDFGTFQNYGYMGLYDGMTATDIHQHKGLKKSQKILDHMGSEELAANFFRVTQAEAKLRREGIKGKMNANRAHLEVGKKVRQTIAELGGSMP